MPSPVLTPVVRAIPPFVPFVGPEAQERGRGRPFRARLGANESPFGPSPKAIAAMQAAAPEAWKYADPESHDLRDAIAGLHGVEARNVIIGEGIDGLLGLAVRLVTAPGDAVVTSAGAYPTFNFHVAANGGRLVPVPYRNDREDLDALLAAAHAADARVLYVANPDNPMGSCWGADEIGRLIARLPGTTLLLLDEAYCDTAPPGSLAPIDIANPCVLRLRTFSKAYGLAGARIGYALGEAALIAEFEKVRNHYGINRIGQIGALAAVLDQSYLAETVSRIGRARDRIGTIATTHGLVALASATNFVTLDCGRDGPFAKRVLEALIARDIFVRKPMIAPLDRCIRVSCGLDADLDRLAEALPAALKDARAG
jgi:histidinol-phosphate aminotransferase